MQFYFEEGLFIDLQSILGGCNFDTGHAQGTFYLYRLTANDMGGTALGYNHVGNGAFFRPTIPIPASKIPGLGPADYPIGTNGIVIESAPYIADRKNIPSVALSQSLSGVVLGDYACSMGVRYLSGNALFPGCAYYQFPIGGVSYGMGGFWGPFSRNASPREVIFDQLSSEGPVEVSFGADGYTTTTVTLTSQTMHGYGYENILAPTTGKSASQYLQEIDYEPSPPPIWVKKMALEEKLIGKTQWLYPPLTRYADVNGDGVYDAADIAKAYEAGKASDTP